MTLYDLMESTTIQGNIFLSVWNDEHDSEVATEMMENCEGLDCYELDKLGCTLDVDGHPTDIVEWNMYEVKYIFCAGDGYLHIELKKA